MTNKQWEEILLMQKSFKRLNDQADLVAIYSDSIQLRYEGYVQLVPKNLDNVQESDNSWLHRAMIDGIEVVAVKWKK